MHMATQPLQHAGRAKPSLLEVCKDERVCEPFSSEVSDLGPQLPQGCSVGPGIRVVVVVETKFFDPCCDIDLFELVVLDSKLSAQILQCVPESHKVKLS